MLLDFVRYEEDDSTLARLMDTTSPNWSRWSGCVTSMRIVALSGSGAAQSSSEVDFGELNRRVPFERKRQQTCLTSTTGSPMASRRRGVHFQ
jgi:hypothetical protein